MTTTLRDNETTRDFVSLLPLTLTMNDLFKREKFAHLPRAISEAGRITAAGMTKEVSFEPAEGSINDRVDKAYQTKYRSSPYLAPMIGERARAATVKIVPRETRALTEEKRP
jgi:hypothetical protein